MAESINMTLVNGDAAGSIPVADRGLAYGHGVFETMRVSAGKPVLWADHRARLERGCERLKIPVDGIMDLLEAEVMALACEHAEAVIKVIVTAGAGGRGYGMPADLQINRVVSRMPLPEYPEAWYKTGIRIRSCDHRLAPNSPLAGIKHLNRLDQVLARAEWSDPEIAEGILVDTAGVVVEGTMTNLFGYRDEELVTPKLDTSGVAGVLRSFVLKQAQFDGLVVREVSLGTAEFQRCNELFVCNSVAGIWPVTAWNEQRYEIGPVTCALAAQVNTLFNGS